MIYVVLGTAAVYLFTCFDPSFAAWLYFNPTLVLRGQIWRLVTFLFIPAQNNLIFEAISLYFYYFIGKTLEQHWGTACFTLYYFTGVILTILYGILMSLLGFRGEFLSPTYIHLSMFFAFATMFPDVRVLLFFFIPIKMKWLAIVDAVLFFVEIMMNSFPTNLLPLLALLNYFVFCWPSISRFFSRLKRRGQTPSSKTVNFNQARKKAERETASAPYRHKCAVCGRTDTDHPELQFRYCSRCVGYHCFCSDHIDHHVHFTE